jgi:hypothetical protein
MPTIQWGDRLFDFGNGVYVTVWDLVKGLCAGATTKGVEALFKVRPNMQAAFAHGFIVGGAVQSEVLLLDNTFNYAVGNVGVDAVIHALTYLLFTGAVAGLTNLGLTLVLAK